jgi:hypothetical protein
MLACCAYYLVDVAPVLGLSCVVIFFSAYKEPLLWLGITMNLVGIAYLLRKIRHQRKMGCETVGRSTKKGEDQSYWQAQE